MTMYAIALVLMKLTFWEVITDIPHDFAAVVTYAILAMFIVGIWYGSRGKAALATGVATSERRDH
jgi:hypothetical protein